MKQILQRLGFRKIDEMEQYIIFKSQRNAYLFLIAVLFIWSLYESYKVYVYHGRLNLFPCLLLVTACLIQTFSQLILMRNAVKDDDESFMNGPLVKIIVLSCAVFSILAAIVTSFLFMGVRA